jgi:ABC-type lipoprotein export system ATPase subunit
MIEIRDVTKIYSRPDGGTVAALNGASLSISRGEFVAIVGASGSGKSTLMHIIGLLDAPTAGQYAFDGRDVASLDPDEQARFRNSKIGFVFQSFHLMPRASALENVELPLLYSDREAPGAGAKALLAVGLGERMSHTPRELSGGQQQRVAIARALVNEPDLILADEPTGNLDPSSAKDVMDILRSLHAAGRTIVLVTHDANLAEQCGRIARIENGRIVSDRKASGMQMAVGSET